MASNPWEILNQNRLNIPGLMQAAGEAKTRRLQEMMLNRQIEREDQQFATRAKATEKLGAGDTKGARQTALAGGDFDLIKHLDTMDEAAKAQVAKRAEIIGNLAQWADNPQKWDQAIDFAVSQGYDDLAPYKGKFSPESRMSAISMAGQTKEYLDRSKPVNMAPGGRLVDPVTGKVIAEAPFAPRPITVGEGQTVVEYAPGTGGGDIFSRMIGAESGGQQFAPNGSPLTSPAGAIGIAQVMPGTAPEAAALAGLPWDEQRYRSDPDYNAAIGKAYFEKQLETFRDPALAVAAYNAGPGAVQNAVQKAGDNWLQALPAETQNYVGKVLGGGDPTSSGGARVIAQGPAKQEKAPSGYRWTPQGTLAPIKGGPADKKSGGANTKAIVDLRKEFNNLPEVKAFKDVRAGYNQVKAVGLKKNATAQDDIAMIFSFMKILDPGSVVREGEFATAQNAAGIPDAVRNQWNRALSGERLNDSQRREMVKTARTMYQQREATYNEAAGQYQGYARDLGIEPTTIARRFVPPKTAQTSIARVKNDADYNKLPSGAMFIAPDGTRRKKP